MIAFRQMTFKERLLRLWPPHRKRMDAELRASIKWLIDHPEAPCIVESTFVPNGYGGEHLCP